MRSIVNFLFEIGHLKRVPRSGWGFTGVSHPESVAEHSYRTAVIGFILGLVSGVDAERVAILCLFHDIEEARTSDLHRLAKSYLEPKGKISAGRSIKRCRKRLFHLLVNLTKASLRSRCWLATRIGWSAYCKPWSIGSMAAIRLSN
ncbi:MAG: HD domain-containing protein [Thermoanaerobaculales bacterium]|nr:HD domain-containing protein [Thermoanaerobaculales bacterium]